MNYTEPSAHVISFMKSINKTIRKMKKYGKTPTTIRVSPELYCKLSGANPHRQWDPEAVYGMVCGLNVHVDDSLISEDVILCHVKN